MKIVDISAHKNLLRSRPPWSARLQLKIVQWMMDNLGYEAKIDYINNGVAYKKVFLYFKDEVDAMLFKVYFGIL